jgi:hypothetical protein
LPEHTEIIRPRRSQQVPAEVIEALTRLTARYDGCQLCELARIIHSTCNYRIADKTIKKLWQQSSGPVQGALPVDTYHSHPHRYQARLQVIKLYYQGWNRSRLSAVLPVSRPTVALWMRRFAAEHLAGLEDKSRAPTSPARKGWLPLMIEV